MVACQENAFCASLSNDVRSRLCKHCIKTSFAAGTAEGIDENHPALLLSGILCAEVDDKPISVVVPNDFILTPRFRPEGASLPAIDDEAYQTYLSDTSYVCLTDTKMAMFSTRIVKELFETVSFMQALFASTINQLMQMSYFLHELYHGSAYDAVRYALKIARAYDVPKLTHAQIAHMTGRNRTTVTQVMHQIALSEPDLLL